VFFSSPLSADIFIFCIYVQPDIKLSILSAAVSRPEREKSVGGDCVRAIPESRDETSAVQDTNRPRSAVNCGRAGGGRVSSLLIPSRCARGVLVIRFELFKALLETRADS
jgi:hypothetical protein